MPTILYIGLVGANEDWLAYLWPDTAIILHNIHNCATIPVNPFLPIGIDLSDWLVLNTYDDAYMRLKKIAIADPPTKRRGYNDYYLIAVFDIRIAINARGSNGRGWRMLAAADLYPYMFKDCAPSRMHLRSDKSGDFFHLVAILRYGRLQMECTNHHLHP